MPWLQLFADTSSDHAPAFEDALFNAGAASVTFTEHIPRGQQESPILEPTLGETPLWDTTRVVGLFDADINTQSIQWLLQEHLGELISKHSNSSVTLRWEQLEDKDWEREWMKNYHPIQCAENLWICPSWATPPNPDAINILLDPGLAFGTGTHPTTFLCLQWLAKQNLSHTTVMDYGCGSGILGVAALLLGTTNAVGVDIDPQALIASRENLQRNQLEAERFTVYQPHDCPDIQVDVMVANILAGPLVDLAETLIAPLKSNGFICLSGILSTQADAVMQVYAHAINFDPVSQKDEWVRLTGRKK